MTRRAQYPTLPKKEDAKALDEQQALELFLETGAEEPFCVLFETLFPRVRRYFLLRGLDRMASEDLAQNVMLTIYRRAGDLRDRELFNGWLFKIARNELLQHFRRQEPPKWMVALEPLNETLAEKLAMSVRSEEPTQFAHWMSYLEPPERELVRLRFVDELSYEELAMALGVPLGTVKWRLFNARKKLSSVIGRKESNDVTKAPRRL